MDFNGILQRISQLKEQIFGQPKIISPIPEPESQDEYNSRMIEKMRAVKGGETPDQETVNLMRKQAANGLYPEGNKWLGTSPGQQGAVKGVSQVVRHPDEIGNEMRSIQEMNTPSPTPDPSVRIDPNVAGFLDKTIIPISRKYKAPDSIMAGMFGAEGRLSGMGANRNNYYNIAGYDSNPHAANYYDTPEKGVEAFARFITGQADNYPSPKIKKQYQDAFAKYQKDGDAESYMRSIENAGYAGDPKTYHKRSNSGFKSYSDFVMNTPEYKRHNYKKK